jgi:protein TonB
LYFRLERQTHRLGSEAVSFGSSLFACAHETEARLEPPTLNTPLYLPGHTDQGRTTQERQASFVLPSLGLSARLRACAWLGAATLHGIVLAALIARHAVQPPVVPRAVALRLITLPSITPAPAPADVVVRTPILPPPAWAPVIAPPDVQVEPRRPHAELSSTVAAPAPPQRQAGMAPETALPRSAQLTAQSAGAESRSWQDRLSAWLQAHRTYPDAARRAGEEGSPTIRFTIARDGSVTAVSLIRTSGSGQLDTAALALLDHAQVPALPPNFPDTVTVTISVRYSLNH